MQYENTRLRVFLITGNPKLAFKLSSSLIALYSVHNLMYFDRSRIHTRRKFGIMTSFSHDQNFGVSNLKFHLISVRSKLLAMHYDAITLLDPPIVYYRYYFCCIQPRRANQPCNIAGKTFARALESNTCKVRRVFFFRC